MITFPNTKINLGLDITEKHPGGYHNLETVFYSASLGDALGVTILNDSRQKPALHQSGLEISGESGGNLTVETYLLLDREFQLPPTDVYLYRHTFSGAGLGDDSTGTAFTLKLLNEKFHLHLANEKPEEYAAVLGANCAFFVRNKPTFAEDVGNVFSSIDLSLKECQLVLIKPDIFVSTRGAFSFIRPRHPEHSLKEVVKRPVNERKDNMLNDFKEGVFPQYPIIEDIKEKLYRRGAVCAAVSDPSSSVSGLFNPEERIADLDFGRIFCFQTKLK